MTERRATERRATGPQTRLRNSNLFGPLSGFTGFAGWFKSWAWECSCLAAFLVLTGWQLFLYPVTGLSDNNDFAKVLGPAHICKASPENLNTYFVSGYAAGPKCAWPSGFSSSEILFVNAARYLSRPFTGRYFFDIRASAAVHLVVLALAMGVFLRVTRQQHPRVRYGLPLLAMVMFSDVVYVSYLNSGYMDNASFVLFLLAASIAGVACVRPGAGWTAPAYGIAGVLLVFSKAQHAVLGIPFAVLAMYFAWRDRDPTRRLVWLFASMGLVLGTMLMPSLTPPEYRNISLYNLIFFRLAPADRTVLTQLGLDSRYQQWIGTHAFAAGSPLTDPDWARAFESQVSFLDVAALYLHHPEIAVREIDRELHDSVHAMRPDYMANYRREDGFPPHSVATRFSFWSNLRTRVLTEYPHLLLWLYGLPLLVAWRKPKFLPLALMLTVCGVGEFALCTLADAVDTHRHMFLFHVITEIVILLTAGWLLTGRFPVPPELP